ncbi:hypothetical protein [Streptomyces sp. PSKA30]|uniref:alpha/beta fold hydrolase n=1 Tax=Streptomyces sp. PSKA30 TaxID=2874597 RepID=UPI0027E152AF|nr:hypothetical protein [Streptomyces sp. PSKA30]
MTRTVTTDDGVRLWASRSGTGTPLVPCHGGPGLWDMFEDVAELLADLATLHRWPCRGCAGWCCRMPSTCRGWRTRRASGERWRTRYERPV